MDWTINQCLVGYHQPLVEGVSIQFKTGSLTSLIGKNGAGKSTFLKSLAGIIPFISIDLTIDGEVVELQARQLARKVAFNPTGRISNHALLVKDYLHIRLGRNGLIGPSITDLEEWEQLLEEVGLPKLYLHRKLMSLSDGEYQKIMLVALLAIKSNLYLLDEPTSHLDLGAKVNMFTHLKRLAESANSPVICSTHDVELAFRYSDKILFFHEGKIEDGMNFDSQEVFQDHIYRSCLG